MGTKTKEQIDAFYDVHRHVYHLDKVRVTRVNVTLVQLIAAYEADLARDTHNAVRAPKQDSKQTAVVDLNDDDVGMQND